AGFASSPPTSPGAVDGRRCRRRPGSVRSPGVRRALRPLFRCRVPLLLPPAGKPGSRRGRDQPGLPPGLDGTAPLPGGRHVSQLVVRHRPQRGRQPGPRPATRRTLSKGEGPPRPGPHAGGSGVGRRRASGPGRRLGDAAPGPAARGRAPPGRPHRARDRPRARAQPRRRQDAPTARRGSAAHPPRCRRGYRGGVRCHGV
ncbi:MAG: hypothetical protein AVDCRST_MAG49-1712, partial [uncultured Thermomicrobiales bacterium]